MPRIVRCGLVQATCDATQGAAADIKKANGILIGHGHVDHMSDAASVGIRTGAIVAGAPVTTEKLLTQGIDPKQVKTVTGKGLRLMGRRASW